MITSKTFLFTSLSEMSGEYTFRFSPFQGTIFFQHELNLTAYSNWGKFTAVLYDAGIQLPYRKQIFVSGSPTQETTGRRGFGTLYIQAKEIKADSITIKYWVDIYTPELWYSHGFTWEGILSCETDSSAETEIIETFRSSGYRQFELADIFDFESRVYIQATDGITGGGTRICTIKTDSGESIQVTLTAQSPEEGINAKYYRGSFLLTAGQTSQSAGQLHFDSFERAILQCDINLDGVFATREIWAGERPPPPEARYVKVYASSLYSIEKYEFNAEEIAYVIVTDGKTSGVNRSLIVRGDSGDSITIPLTEDIATRYKCSFKITNGATDKINFLIHLEAGERATLTCHINEDIKPLTVFVYRTGVPVETVKTYTNVGYGVEADTFDLETNVFVEATNSSETGGKKILKVVASSSDTIYVTLTEGPATCYRGYFKITAASTRDDNNEIHLDSGEKAILSCDIDGDGVSASTKIWADIKPDDPDPLDATHYQIQVNTQKNMLGTMMWDSQKCQLSIVVSPDDRCPEIEYNGTQLNLSGNITYWWRIRFWVNNGTLVSPWSVEEAYFSGSEDKPDPDDPDPDNDIPDLAAMDIRKPRGKAEVLIDGSWTDLETVTAVQVSNNKNPLDNIETAQGTVYLSNIGKGFYPDKSDSQFHNELFGRKIRLSLGFLDYPDTMVPIYKHKMIGIIKSINTNRKEKTAEIVVLEFMDFYKTKELKITPVWENESLTWIFCALVKECFPSWRNQHEAGDNFDYWVDPLGFRRTNIYLGSGEASGSEFLPIKDCLRTPCEWIYNITPSSEAIYNNNERRLIRGTDYEILQELDDKGSKSWIHFLKAPYPTNDDTFYATVTVDVKVSIVQYKNTTLIEELEKIALVADCRIYADGFGRLMCKSNALETTITENISYDTNLMDISTRKDIDSIINHVVVESKPFQLGVEVEIGQVTISFPSRASAEAGRERQFYLDEFMKNFLFDLTWDIECMMLWGAVICTGTGTKENFELPLRDRDGNEGIELSLSGSIFCTNSYGKLHIETVSIDAEQIVVKAYINIHDTRAYDNTINFSATLNCKGEGIGQPETYRGEAIDEVSYQDRFIKKQKKTFVLEYLEPGDTQARQAAYALLASLRKIRVYYDCSIRGLPHLRLMNTVALTSPDLELSGKNMQVIKLSDNMQIANYTGELGLLERKIVTKVPFYWYPVEHDFIINTTDQLTQTIKFGFNAEIDKFNFSHIYKLFVTKSYTFPWGDEIFIKDCYGEGEDNNFELPYVVDILVYYRKGGMDIPMQFGNLGISLIEATPTSIEIQYLLEVIGGDPTHPLPKNYWQWPIDWLGTLSMYVEFKREGEIAEPGDAPEDEPHYPEDEPFTPPDDQPDDGWEYEPPEVTWPLTKEDGGVLTLTEAPTIDEYVYCGFNIIIPFFSGATKTLREQYGVKVIANIDKGTNVWPDESKVLAYFLGDELSEGTKCSGHKCTPNEIKGFYDLAKTVTSKPVGSIWVGFPPDSYYDAINYLDFAIFDDYPYWEGRSDEWALNRMKALRDRIRDRVNVPVIIIAQAEDASHRLRNPTNAGIWTQRDFWYNLGYPVIWYSWTGSGTVDIKRSFQDLMHQFYG